MSTTQPLSASVKSKTPLTRNQIRGFLASWGGWALDGMDSFIYALVLVPALKELLPRSGIPANAANLGYYSGVLFALLLTILCYSLFTFLGAVATTVWQLAAFRLLAGIGIGGEWALGGILVAEA